MKGSLANEILMYLYYEDVINEDVILISNYLTEKQNTDTYNNDTLVWNNFNRIKNAIDKIEKNNYATFSYIPHGPLGTLKLGRTCRLENTEVRVKFHPAGFEYIRNFIRENEQHNSILETNKSVIESNRLSGIVNASIVDLNRETKKYYSQQDETNKSVVELNTKTKSYYTQLKWATWVIAIATIISMSFSALNLRESYLERTAIKPSLDTGTLQLLQGSLKAQIAIDSSLEKVARNVSSLKKK